MKKDSTLPAAPVAGDVDEALTEVQQSLSLPIVFSPKVPFENSPVLRAGVP